MSAQKYHISLRILHWLMAVMIITMLCIGFYMKSLPNNSEQRLQIILLHKSFGITILLLVLLRLAFRLFTKIPPLPQTMSQLIRNAAIAGHWSLYILMIIMPLSGYLMSAYFGFAVHLFSLPLPALIEFNPRYGHFFEKSHEYLAFIFIFVITVHILAALKHRFFDKKENNILPRIL